MRTCLCFVHLLTSVISLPVRAQAPDSVVQPPKYSAPRFMRVSSENDIFQLRRTDIRDASFTNSIRVDLMGNFWKRLPTRRLLLELPRQAGSEFDELYSFSVGQEIYTPASLTQSAIMTYDRPYAGWLYASTGLVHVDVVNARKLTSSLSVGVMGPRSQAGPVQTWFHHRIDSPIPQGWHNQIVNSFGISYAVRYEQRPVPVIHRSFDLIGLLEGHAGTVTNYVGAGFTLRLGLFNDYFQNAIGLYDRYAYQNEARNAVLFDRVKQEQTARYADPDSRLRRANRALDKPTLDSLQQQAVDRVVFQKKNPRWQLYLFMRPVARVMLDNSLLQGGWRFRKNRLKNPYVIKSEDITHFYANVEYGGVFALKRFQVCYTQSFRTREFRYGQQQQWGRVSVLFGMDYCRNRKRQQNEQRKSDAVDNADRKAAAKQR